MSAPPDLALALALEHLLLRLRPVNRALRRLAERRAARAEALSAPDRAGACITERHARALFAAVDDLDADPVPAGWGALDAAEQAREAAVRARAAELDLVLPLDRAEAELGLTPSEQWVLVLCAAPEIDRSYARLFAYVHDDLNRMAPSVELVCDLGAGSLADRIARRREVAPHAPLRRLGLIEAVAGPPDAATTAFALGPGAFDALTRPNHPWAGRFGDADAVDVAAAVPLKLFPDAGPLRRLAEALRRDPACLIGLWGRAHHGPADAALALAAEAGRPLRRLRIDLDQPERVEGATACAEALDAALWLEVDALDEEAPPSRLSALAETLGRARAPLVLTGRRPWHPLPLLAGRSLLVAHLAGPSVEQRERLWRDLAPEIREETARDLAERYQLSPREVAAALRAARVRARLAGNGRARPLDESLNGACRSVVQRQGARFATLVTPQRRPDELILPRELHERVVEVARLYRNAGRVDDHWGFGRMVLGAGGVRVLMTGDSGTGKTAAAEVIAGLLDDGPTLLKVDLASVVSKWVGETEKNLEAVFQHAEESHCVLFFDEADALFSKRGEVQRGADRYSNLEVGYLLQRLEEFAGLTILASNHKDQIDDAFTRRFQVVLHFPRPGVDERRRLWRVSLPVAAPLDADVDLEALTALDLTGAGIAGAARTAALLAADGDSGRIGMRHLVRAAARQFQNEARLMPLAQIGRYAGLAGPEA